MAFQKTITQINSGIFASYWRLAGVFIDPVAQAARLVLVGYVSVDIRQANGQGIDTREFSLTPSQYLALAQAAAVGPTTFDVIGAACYGHIATAKRKIPIGAMFDPNNMTLTIPSTGEVIQEADIDFDSSDQPMWIPSEFADALTV